MLLGPDLAGGAKGGETLRMAAAKAGLAGAAWVPPLLAVIGRRKDWLRRPDDCKRLARAAPERRFSRCSGGCLSSFSCPKGSRSGSAGA